VRVYVATKNRGKFAELEAIFKGSPVELLTYDGYADVEEGDISFHDNALLKARTLHAQLENAGIEAAVIADDSGLCVDALDGRPGVLSARYAGDDATREQRRVRLLEELRDVPNDRRTAVFVCYMPLMLADGRTWMGEGFVRGRIAREERGAGGFGYDPVFVPDGETRTFAEMGEEKKNEISHRHAAAMAIRRICEGLV
jgi:XTP/dITP diphosphohydrolase